MTRYMRWLKDERGLEFDDYAALWRWSTEDLEAFWGSLWEFFDVQASYDEVLADRSMPGAQWFSGAELSYPEHIFRDRPGDRVAIRHASELRDPGEWTWDELREQTARVRAGLQAMGIERGDRVVAYMPNIPETIAAFFATACLGAVWSSCSPDFGARSVVDRFAQIEPKVLLTVDGYRYGGKDHDRSELIEKVQGEMPSLEHTVTLGYLDRRQGRLGRGVPGDRRGARRSTACPSSTRCGSSTRRAPPACRRRSCTRRAGSCSSTSRSTTSTSTPRRATASSGSPPRAG